MTDQTDPIDLSEYGYRPAVGVMLINKAGKVWVGQRLDSTLEAWQMPQGGLDSGESPRDGALRELHEETGIDPALVEILAQAREELSYDLPEDLIGKIWKEKWRGQRQTWFLARFLGTDSDVHIDTPDPEFRAWRWAEPDELPAMIVPFKRKLYEAVVASFREWL
ncbi:MAG: putative (di)nucleoside polyphosphate hydrolase [Sphingomonadales bacterium]|jgi:putative (di)nucleoside polyphosphate hydrolase|nr:putative (di)nucleoside polyphosphate hydrolase [Sphingomonadales bacterium]